MGSSRCSPIVWLVIQCSSHSQALWAAFFNSPDPHGESNNRKPRRRRTINNSAGHHLNTYLISLSSDKAVTTILYIRAMAIFNSYPPARCCFQISSHLSFIKWNPWSSSSSKLPCISTSKQKQRKQNGFHHRILRGSVPHLEMHTRRHPRDAKCLGRSLRSKPTSLSQYVLRLHSSPKPPKYFLLFENKNTSLTNIYHTFRFPQNHRSNRPRKLVFQTSSRSK